MALIRAFTVRLAVWTTGLLLVHTTLRAATDVGAPWSFVADLFNFSGPILVIGALAAGIGTAAVAAREESYPSLGDTARVSAVGAMAGVLAYVLMSWVTPAVMPDGLAGVEPRATPSADIRDRLGAVSESIEVLPDAEKPSAWRQANIWAFEHERRIVQSVLVPVLAVVGLLVGFWASELQRTIRPLAIWGVALFLTATMYLAMENGYELIVLRSAGPMAFVPWLQLIVPGAVLVGLLLPTCTRWGAFASTRPSAVN